MFYTVGKADFNPNYYSEERYEDVFCVPHIHSHIEFVFVLDGIMELDIEKKPYIMHKNEMAVVMPYEIHEFKTHGSSDMFVVEFSQKYFSEYRSVLEGKAFKNPQMKISSVLQRLLKEFIGSDKDIFRKKAFAYFVISEFLKNSELVIGKAADDVFIKAAGYMTENFRGDISLGKTASALGVTSVHLSRLFSKKAGFSFTEFVNLIRLKEAAELLNNTDLSISEISFEAGFGSIRNFNRVFEKYYKCTPKEMRINNKV